jgi:hypothetical protein
MSLNSSLMLCMLLYDICRNTIQNSPGQDKMDTTNFMINERLYKAAEVPTILFYAGQGMTKPWTQI